MTFLPIVDRELRVAARKRGTFWVRIIAALVALLIAAGFLILASFGTFGMRPASFGRGLFATLTWLSLAAALSAGLFFTSDCLSEEKREGTIGFLFLTDLAGYDIVLGKLLATSLRGVYALLAVFPILAVTVLMGGVTGEELWKSMLALAGALSYSLAAGLLISAVSRDAQKALGASLLLLLMGAAGGPVVDNLIGLIKKSSFEPILSLASPAYAFVSGQSWGAGLFWTSLLLSQLVALSMLGMACALLPRSWQQKTRGSAQRQGSWAEWWRFGGSARRRALRRKLLEVNPVLWLACRERWQASALWVVALCMIGAAVAMYLARSGNMGWYVWSYVQGALTLGVYLGMASHAGRFFVEAGRSGLTELLLATPLSGSQIVLGQWQALLRMFGPPLALCLAAQLAGGILLQSLTWNRVAAATATPAVTGTNTLMTNATGASTTTTSSWGPTTATTTSVTFIGAVNVTGPAWSWSWSGLWVAIAVALGGTLTVVGNLAALCWFGMWTGLNSKKTNLATLLTILCVQIVPWFVITFASSLLVPLLFFSGLITGLGASPRSIVWYPLLMGGLGTVLYLAKNAGFVLWSRRKLNSQFRDRAARAAAPIHITLPPPRPPTVVPPVLPA